jgi:hypothetical protein
MSTAPSTFISYSWDDDAHRTWVRELGTRLRGDGVDVVLDQWHTAPGDQLPEFMERAIRDNQYVLIVCTPGYKRRADARTGGVGYEGDIITGEVVTSRNHRKFIPVLRSGEWTSAAPTWLAGKYFVDLRGAPYSDAHYSDLVATLHGDRVKAPPLGPKPTSSRLDPAAPLSSNIGGGAQIPPSPDTPIRITGIVADEVTMPRLDGTRGSALYEVPFRLSRRPPSDWSDLFVRSWDHPPRWTSMHRPGIASVEGDKVWLRGTTLEEVERTHRDTLKLAVDEANRLSEELRLQRETQRRAAEERTRAHSDSVRDAANRIKFD